MQAYLQIGQVRRKKPRIHPLVGRYPEQTTWSTTGSTHGSAPFCCWTYCGSAAIISIEHNARKAPNVLSFDVELVLDGRTLPRPVNYGFVRIVPPAGTVD